MPSVSDAVVGAGRGVGRHFSIVAMIPAFLAVVWLWFVARAVGSDGTANTTDMQGMLDGTTFADLGLLIGFSLAVGLITQPFQFAFTQLLEGYWGGWTLFHELAAKRINHYRAKRRGWARRGESAEEALISTTFPTASVEQRREGRDELLTKALLEMDGKRGDSMIVYDQVSRFRYRFERRFPDRPGRIMPTRLGNALRAFEDEAGKQYGLDATVIAGHLSLLPDHPTSAYVRDTRQTLDLTVRLCMLGLLVSPLTAVLLVRSGPWALVALVPFGVSYLAYVGSVHAARAYGNAVRFQIDLRRSALYEALLLTDPRTPHEEREQNRRLITQLASGPDATSQGAQGLDQLRYRQDRPSP